MDSAQQIELDAMSHVKRIEEAAIGGGSEIQQFYHNVTLFLTGATGFAGKQLVEKLFRSCDIKKAYVLIRSKRGMSVEERLQAMLDDPVFNIVRQKKPDLDARIVPIKGEVSDIQMGISGADWDILTKEVDVIFHEAATTRFNENICKATLVNVKGTREALKLGKACNKLRSFVYASTAYCQAKPDLINGDILEQFYKSPLPPEILVSMAENIDENRLDSMTSSLTKGWFNTYMFTKAVAEELVRLEAENLPVCIIRPTIGTPAYREPLPGWLDQSSLNGPSGLVLGFITGMLHVVPVNKKVIIPFVPVDFVTNATITAGWETALRNTSQIKIYHISTSCCGIKFSDFLGRMSKPEIRSLASPKALWLIYLIETNSRHMYWFLSWMLHYIPAYAIDGIIYVFKLDKIEGVKSVVNMYKKYDKMYSVFGYFLKNEWRFDSTNLQNLWKKMSATDKVIYNFDMKSIDWDENACMFWLGLRKYILKDGLKKTKTGNTLQKWFKRANYAVLVLYLFLFWKIPTWVYHAVKKMYFLRFRTTNIPIPT